MVRFQPTFAAVGLALALTAFPSRSQVLFRPSLYEVTFYEAGVIDSRTGQRAAIFQSSAGVTVDLSVSGAVEALAKNAVLPDGVWDQVYSLVSNTQVYSGSDGKGCFVKAGQVAYDGGISDPLVATSNKAEAGVRRVTFTSYRDGGGPTLGPMKAPSSGQVLGNKVLNLQGWLVSSRNPVPGGGGLIDRHLTIGDLSRSLKTPDDTLDLEVVYDLSDSFRTQGDWSGGPGCKYYRVVDVKFDMRY